MGHFKPQGALSQHRGANSLLRWVLLRSRCQFSLLDHQKRCWLHLVFYDARVVSGNLLCTSGLVGAMPVGMKWVVSSFCGNSSLRLGSAHHIFCGDPLLRGHHHPWPAQLSHPHHHHDQIDGDAIVGFVDPERPKNGDGVEVACNRWRCLSGSC